MLKKENEILQKEKDNLKKELCKMNIANEEIINKYKKLTNEKMKIVDGLISKLKTNVVGLDNNRNINLSSGEKFIAINFMSIDKRISHSVICKNKTKFEDIENEFYSKYPEYTNNYFMFNGLQINRQKTLEENGIHGYAIMLNKIENE